jgi:hypothetical protein
MSAVQFFGVSVVGLGFARIQRVRISETDCRGVNPPGCDGVHLPGNGPLWFHQERSLQSPPSKTFLAAAESTALFMAEIVIAKRTVLQDGLCQPL